MSVDDTHAQLVEWFEDWTTATADARALSAKCEDYYHGRQWTSEDIDELQRRGQPALTRNRIFKKINFLAGDEIQQRTDPKALPRTIAHQHDVGAMTDAIRYVADKEGMDQLVSQTWMALLISAYRAVVVDHESDKRGNIQIRMRGVPFDRFWADPYSRTPDYSDADYLGVHTWWSYGRALAYYRKHPHAVANVDEVLGDSIGSSDKDGDTYEDKPSWLRGSGRRKRICVSECYYLHTDAETGSQRWHVAHYTHAGWLIPPKPTGYLDENGDDMRPIEAVSAFITRDGERYPLAMHMLDPQDAINKQASKYVHHLSVDRLMVEESALLDIEQARNERAKPDGVVVAQRGAITDGRIQIDKGLDVAQGHMALLQEAKAEIDTIGPEIPQLGSVSSNASGRSIQIRQQIGNLELAPLKDNLRQFRLRLYTQIWCRIRQFWTDEKWLRVTDDTQTAGFRFVGLNRRVTRAQRLAELLRAGAEPAAALSVVGLPDGALEQATQAILALSQQRNQPTTPEQAAMIALQQIAQSPQMQAPMIANDVAKTGIDIVLDESPDVAIIAQEEYENLTQLMPTFLQTMPQRAPQLLQLVLEASQLRNKRKLIKMLDSPPPDPQAQQLQQAQQQLALASMQAGVHATQAKAQLDAAKAQATAIDAQIKTPAEVTALQARAMRDAAAAGEKSG